MVENLVVFCKYYKKFYIIYNMNKLKIGIFAYNWPHLKSQQGLINMCMKGFKPAIVFGADPVVLKFYKSKVRITPKEMYLHDTKDICKFYNIPYVVLKHNSKECMELIREKNLDVGVILGARILKKYIIDAFNIGVINAHPGLLPENRGLDTIKWAIIKNLEQGVTCHFVDHKIDIGREIVKEKINVYNDDTLIDLYLRIQSKEQKMLIESLKIVSRNKDIDSYKKLTNGDNYHKSVPPDIEKDLFVYFERYKNNFGE